MTLRSWKRQTRAGIGWSIGTFAGGRALTFVATMVLARLLVPEEFGVVAAILVYLSALELIGDLGMKATVVYEQDRESVRRVESAFTLNLGLAVVLTGIAVVCAPLVAGFFDVSEHAGLFRLASLSLLLTGVGNVQDALLLRELDFRRRAISELTRGGVRGLVSVALAFAGLGAGALVGGLLAGQLAWVAVLWTITRYRPRLVWDRGIVRSMVGYGSGAMALDVVAAIGGRLDQIIIGPVLGPAALGIYVLAYRVPELLISSVSWSFSKVSFPALSRVRANDRGSLGPAILSLLRYQALGTLPVSCALAVLGPALVVVLFSDKWAEGGAVLSAIAVAEGVEALLYPLGDSFKAIGRQRTMLGINLANLPLMVAVILLAAPHGIVWVAWAVAAQSLFHTLWTSAVVSRAFGLRARELLGAIRPGLAAGAGAALGAGAMRMIWPEPALGPLLAGGLAAMALSLVFLRVLAPSTFAELVRLAGEARRRVFPPRSGEPPAEPSPRTPSEADTGRAVLAVRARGLLAAGGGLVPCAVLWYWWAVHEGGYPATVWLAGLPILAVLGVALAAFVPRPPLSRAAAASLVALGALAAWTWLSLLWAESPGIALMEAMRRSLYIAAFALAVLWPPTRSGLRIGAWALVLAAVGAGIAGISSALAAGDLPDGRLIDPAGYPNAVAALLNMGGLAALALGCAEGVTRGWRALSWGLTGLLWGMAVLAQSRGGLFALVVALALLVAVAPFRRRLIAPVVATGVALYAVSGTLLEVRPAALAGTAGPELEAAAVALAACALALAAAAVAWARIEPALAGWFSHRRARPWAAHRRRSVGLAVVLLLAATVAVAASPSGRGWANDRYQDFTSPDYDRIDRADSRFEGGLGSNRSDYWRVALDTAAEKPLLGNGAGGFRAEYLAERKTDQAPRFAHAIWAGTLGDLGLPGFAALMVFAAVGGFGLSSAVRRADIRDRALVAASAIPLVYLGIHASADWVSAFPALVVPALGLAGAALSFGARGRAGDRPGSWAAVAVIALVGVVAVPLLQAERLAAWGGAVATERPAAGLDALREAARLNPLAPEPPAWEGLACAAIDRPVCAERALAEAVERDPTGWAPRLVLGLLAAERGADTEARRRLAAAAARNPREPLVRHALDSPGGGLSATEAARRLLDLEPQPSGSPPGGGTRLRSSAGGSDDDPR